MNDVGRFLPLFCHSPEFSSNWTKRVHKTNEQAEKTTLSTTFGKHTNDECQTFQWNSIHSQHRFDLWSLLLLLLLSFSMLFSDELRLCRCSKNTIEAVIRFSFSMPSENSFEAPKLHRHRRSAHTIEDEQERNERICWATEIHSVNRKDARLLTHFWRRDVVCCVSRTITTTFGCAWKEGKGEICFEIWVVGFWIIQRFNANAIVAVASIGLHIFCSTCFQFTRVTHFLLIPTSFRFFLVLFSSSSLLRRTDVKLNAFWFRGDKSAFN